MTDILLAVGTRALPESASAEAGSDGVSTPARSLRDTLRSKEARLVLALTLAGAALRFGTLNVQSVWGDEAATIVLVRHHFGWMLSHFTEDENYPPLYFVLTWIWTRIFGLGPLGFRSLSALAGTLTIPVMYMAGRRISPRAGMWAAALTVVSPAMYYYSQEARCYALLMLFVAASLVFWQRALDEPTGKRLAWWAVLSCLALLTHYFAAFILVPEAIILARRRGWRRVAPAVGVIALVGLALVPLAANEASHGDASWIEATSLGSRLAESIKQFLVGLYGPIEIVTAALVGLLAAAAVVLLVRRGEDRERRPGRDMALMAVIVLAVPVILAAAHVVDVFDGRNVIFAWIPLGLLIAFGLGARRAPRAGTAIGVAICVISLVVVVATDLKPGYQRDDWRAIGRALASSRSGAVIVGETNASLPLSIYLPAIQSVTGSHVTTSEVDFIGLRTRRTGRSPLPAVVDTQPPPGFRLAGVHQTETYTVSRFIARRPTAVSAAVLSRLHVPESEHPRAETAIIRRD